MFKNMSLGGIDPTFDKLFGVYVPVKLPVNKEELNKVPMK